MFEVKEEKMSEKFLSLKLIGKFYRVLFMMTTKVCGE
jgi:hypothetical protein